MGVWGKEKETFSKGSFSFPQPPEAFSPPLPRAGQGEERGKGHAGVSAFHPAGQGRGQTQGSAHSHGRAGETRIQTPIFAQHQTDEHRADHAATVDVVGHEQKADDAAAPQAQAGAGQTQNEELLHVTPPKLEGIGGWWA